MATINAPSQEQIAVRWFVAVVIWTAIFTNYDRGAMFAAGSLVILAYGLLRHELSALAPLTENKYKLASAVLVLASCSYATAKDAVPWRLGTAASLLAAAYLGFYVYKAAWHIKRLCRCDACGAAAKGATAA